MKQARLSRRTRLHQQNGRDPGAVLYDLVYRGDKTLQEAGKSFGISKSTAMRWLRDWEQQHKPQPAEVA